MIVKQKLFFTIVSELQEYDHDINPFDFSEVGNADILTFIERGWCFEFSKLPLGLAKAKDNVALLSVDSFASWLALVKKLTHHDPIKRADKKGVAVRVVEVSEALAFGIWEIYNETPFRQGRKFIHFNSDLASVKATVLSSPDIFIGAYYEDKLIGFLQLNRGEDTLVIAQILSLVEHANKSVNKALLAKAVEVCADLGKGWIVYARMGNHPSLDHFKKENGFVKFPITRYYMPLTWKGKLAILLNLHKDAKDILPNWFKSFLFPIYNWVNRLGVKNA